MIAILLFSATATLCLASAVAAVSVLQARQSAREIDILRARTRPQTAAGSVAGTEEASSKNEVFLSGDMTQSNIAAVISILDQNKESSLDWRHSLVDLLKILDLDASLEARKRLADELHYTGDKADAAAMNIWLHNQIIRKLAETGSDVSVQRPEATGFATKKS